MAISLQAAWETLDDIQTDLVKISPLLVRPTVAEHNLLRQAAEIDARKAGYKTSVSAYCLKAAIAAARITLKDNG